MKLESSCMVRSSTCFSYAKVQKGELAIQEKKENCVFLTCMLTTRLCYINNMVLLVRLLKNDRKSPCLVGH